MRCLGLDYGDKYIGVAISDELGISHPLTVIKRPDRTDLRSTLAAISEIVTKENIEIVVLGNPKNLDNSEGFRSVSTRYFMEKLANVISVTIILEDERLTSQSAKRVLDEANIPRNKQKEMEDKIAASIILQTFLDRQQNEQRANDR